MKAMVSSTLDMASLQLKAEGFESGKGMCECEKSLGFRGLDSVKQLVGGVKS